MGKVDRLVEIFPLYSEEMGINLKKEEGRFKWLLASILFGARIGENIAINTYKTFDKYDVTTPEKILKTGWDLLVQILDEGGYVRYDFKTATKLLNISEKLINEYNSIDGIYNQSRSTGEIIVRLKEFKGIGDVTANIFLRELRGIWDISLPVSERVMEVAKRVDLNIEGFEGEMLSRVETSLVKLNLRYCKKGRCRDCPISDECKSKLK